MNIIEESLYKQIIKSVPILCIDLIIMHNNQYLLVKRKQNPLKNEWWVPGGRVQLGERIENAVNRMLNQELSIPRSNNFKLCAFYQDFFDLSAFGVHPYHTIAVVFKVELLDLPDIKIDQTSHEWKLNATLPKRFKAKLEYISV